MLRNQRQIIICRICLILLIVTAYGFAQKDGGRVVLPKDSRPKTPVLPSPKSPMTKNAPSRKGKSNKRMAKTAKPVTPSLGAVEIRLSTGAGSLYVENTGERYELANGALRLTMKPGLYTLLASSYGYLDERFTINLQAGFNYPKTIALTPSPGYLNVLPNISNSVIKIAGVGTFFERADNLQLPQGTYSVEVSKNGYKTEVYEAKIESLKKTSIAVILEKEPPVRTGYSMTMLRDARRDQKGEYQDLQLTGASADTDAPTGMIHVTLFTEARRYSIVNGMLPGIPCQVDFRAVDDISGFVIEEPPAKENQWSRIRLRVYPKKNKKEVQFVLKWYAIQEEAESFLIQPKPKPPSTQHRVYVNAAKQFRMSYPLNWKETVVSQMNCFAPDEGLSHNEGNVNITHGVMMEVQNVGRANLRQASEQRMRSLLAANSNLKQQGQLKSFEIGGREALMTTLKGISEVTQQTEIVSVYTVMIRKQELLSIAFTRPQNQAHLYWGAFGRMIRNLQFYS
jgi:hypothetical protein